MSETRLFQRILVGVDPERHSQEAAIRGTQLAQEHDSELDLVFAVEVPPPLWPGVGEVELAGIHAAALARARKALVASLEPVFRDAKFNRDPDDLVHVYPGHSARVLVDHSRDLQADLILLGPHEKQSLLDFGRTARGVLARSEVPVWVQKAPVAPIQKILVPVDFSESSRRALEFAQSLAEASGASIRVAHCHAPPSFAYIESSEVSPGPTYVVEHQRQLAKEQLTAWMGEFDWGSIEATSSFVDGDPVHEVCALGDEADLIVMGSHGRTGLMRALLGSVAYSILKRSKQPVVVVPNREQVWQLESTTAP